MPTFFHRGMLAWPLLAGLLAEPGERPGHIPGAISVPFTELASPDGTLDRPYDLAARFRAAGVGHGRAVVVYCHSGNKAAIDYLASRLLGFPHRPI